MEKSEPCIEIHNLSFRYPLSEKPVLNEINLEIQRGEYVVIAGPTGCGKTTLALCLNGVIPNLMEGELSGEVSVNGYSTSEHPVHEFTPFIGLVFQNPEDQLFSLKVVDEIAFGVENMGYSHSEIVERVEQAIQKVHLVDRKDYSIFKLSGGQKQKVAIASNLALSPDILVLDAPTADLDPISSTEVVQTLVDLRRQDPERTFIVIDSDLSDIINLATRLIILKGGSIYLDGSPEELLACHFNDLVALGIRIPAHLKVMNWLRQMFPDLPIFEMEAGKVRELVEELHVDRGLRLSEALLLPKLPSWDRETIIALKDVSFQFENGPTILDHTSLVIQVGELVAVIGENGTGKSTLLKLVSGLLKPQAGTIETVGANTRSSRLEKVLLGVGYLFQNPDHQLFMSTVEDEIGFATKRQGCSPDEVAKRVDDTLDLMGLEAYRRKHPFTLSRGQRQRLAVATVLATRPHLLLLDEPTTGQDQVALDHLMELILSLIRDHGTTVLMVTHDMDLVAQYASRVIVLHQGQVLLDDHPRNVFIQNPEILANASLKIPEIIYFAVPLVPLSEGYIPYDGVLGKMGADF